ncbi:MAG: glycosyltransferase family 4 protein [Ktedonobacteraceae bacterium]|nr:glycosyltransferase family 4 protein [Ktedonobacteraceae bacterium]
MKIAQIAPPWIAIPPKHYGGTEVVLYNLIEEQVAQGHDVTLFAPGDAKTSADLVSFFPRSLLETGVPWPAHLKAYYHLYKSLEQAKEFDIIHTHLSSSSDMYIFPLLAHMTTPHVTTLHSRFPFDRVQHWMGDADTYYMEWASALPMVAISESARAEVQHPLNFVGVVHNGITMPRVVRQSAQKKNDYFVWLGRFVPDKGTHLAIEAAKRAGVPLVLAGTIDRHLPESVQYFQEMIKPYIDDDQVKYIGPVNMRQKVSLLSGARGFLNPIEWEEPFGMVMIEAMAVGCPVISFSRGAAPELIIHRKTGFLVHDVDEMVRFISRIHEIDREVTRAHVEHNFSARVMAAKYLKVYTKVIAMSKGVPGRVFPERSTKPAVAPPVAALVKTNVPAQAPYQLAAAAKEAGPKS